MNITYQASEQDFVRAGMLMLRRKSRFTAFSPWVGGVWLAFLISFIFLDPGARANINNSADWGKVGFGLSIPILLLLMPLLTRAGLRKQYRNSPAMQETRTIQADFSGFHLRSQSNSSDIAWSTFIAFAEDEHSFLLIQQGNLIFVPIPKRQLSEEQVEEVRSVFETYLPRKE
jgi:YcxB-like protein